MAPKVAIVFVCLALPTLHNLHNPALPLYHPITDLLAPADHPCTTA
jgi:hypothetical protein